MSALETSIKNLVSRLETVTSRLEKVEQQIASGSTASHSNSSAGGSGGDGSDSVAVAEYEELISEFIQPYVQDSAKLAPELKEQADLVLQAVNAQKQFIGTAAASKKPDQARFMDLLKPTSSIMEKIVALRESNRKSQYSNQLAAVAEGISALAWVTVEKTPGPYVKESKGSSQFWSNKILTANKEKKDQTQLDWVAHWDGFLTKLGEAYIKKNHTTGLTWNPKGGEASASATAAAPASAPKAAAASAPASAGSAVPKPDLFAALSKGEGVTSGLKKVTNDMKTKNRPDSEKSSVVKAIEPKSTRDESKATKVKKPAKFELQGNKWVIENQSNNRELVISETEPKQTVYIFGCDNSTVQIKGKVNAITVDGCKKTAVVFENAIATFEVVNSQGIEVQILGKVPSLFVDKTDGIQLYLSKDCLASEIIASKSSAVNVHIPGPNQGDDPTELPVPEQFKTTIVNGRLLTQSVEHKD